MSGVASTGLGLACFFVQPLPFAVAMVAGVALLAGGLGAMTWAVGWQ